MPPGTTMMSGLVTSAIGFSAISFSERASVSTGPASAATNTTSDPGIRLSTS